MYRKQGLTDYIQCEVLKMKLYDAMVKRTEKINNEMLSGVKVWFMRDDINPMTYGGYTKKEILEKIKNVYLHEVAPKGVYNFGYDGIEIIDYIGGFDDYVLIRYHGKLSTHKLYYTYSKDDYYFTFGKTRIYLNEVLICR